MEEASKRSPASSVKGPRTLAIDIGGTGIKGMVCDAAGKPVTDRERIPTPKHATPRRVLAIIRKLAKGLGPFNRVSVGFPGLLKDGVVYSAPNLGHGWHNVNLQRELRRLLGRPARIANDADIQGLGAVSGKGLELVITLGTGFGSVVFINGNRIHLELAHHPFHKGKTYEDELGKRALKKKGKAKWNKMLAQAIDELTQTFAYDRLYIGGGNARYIKFKLPPNVKVVSNEDGLLGGVRLWEQAPGRTPAIPAPSKARAPQTHPAVSTTGPAQ